MATLRLSFARCVAFAAPAAVVGAALAWTGHAATESATPWLHAASLLPIAASGLAATSLWPMFSNDAAGRDLVRRATKGPLHGMPTVALSALLAAAIALLALACATAPLVPAPRAARPMHATTRPVLDASQSEASFVVDGACDELRLRPAALLPQDAPEATKVEVVVDGRSATHEPVVFGGHRQLAIVPLGGRVAHEVTLRRVAGNVPLLFDREGATSIAAGERNRVVGCSLAMLTLLLPLAVALAVAMLTAPTCGFPVQAGIVCVALVVQTAGQAGPADAAVTLCARGRWLPGEGLGAACAWSAAIACAAALLAAALPKEARR